MNNTKINVDSTENQRIKGKFVAREVYTCFSYEMEAILGAGLSVSGTELPTHEDVENICYFDTEGVVYKIMTEWDSKENELKDYANNPETFNRRIKDKPNFELFLDSVSDDELVILCREFDIDIDEEENAYQEIFEWWIVSEYLYRKLKELGRPVLEWGNNYYWGRCTTGQAILLDWVISKICMDMEILEGQKYSWTDSKKDGA